MHDLRRALCRYLGEAAAREALIEPLGEGLINDTYLVKSAALGAEHAGQAVLQRLSPIFSIEVNEDIEAVTRHLLARGMPTPLLIRTLDGALAVSQPEGEENAVLRLLTFVPGVSPRALSPELAFQAGALVGRFHEALADLEHRFRFSRPGAHDLSLHRAGLIDAIARGASAPEGFLPAAEEVLRRTESLPREVAGPARICHGDLKASNLRFDEEGRGLCLLDLDTLSEGRLCIELGDAMRSWCNTSAAGEDEPHAAFDLTVFARALSGYAERSRAFITLEEREGLVAGTYRIALELAARFLADVVNQRYFRFDPRRFPDRAAHNLVRGLGQLALARDIEARRGEAEAIVREAYA